MPYHKMIFLKRFRKKVFEMINFRYYFEGLKCIILKTEVTYMYIERVNRKITKEIRTTYCYHPI